MFTVYVLYSAAYEKIYIGYTSDLENRLLSHNALATKGNTVKYRPWKLFYFEEFETKHEAMAREMELKSGKGREYIWNMIKNRPRLM
jgi:putative endonuclease